MVGTRRANDDARPSLCLSATLLLCLVLCLALSLSQECHCQCHSQRESEPTVAGRRVAEARPVRCDSVRSARERWLCERAQRGRR